MITTFLTLLRTTALASLVLFAFFIGGTKAEAASTTWYMLTPYGSLWPAGSGAILYYAVYTGSTDKDVYAPGDNIIVTGTAINNGADAGVGNNLNGFGLLCFAGPYCSGSTVIKAGAPGTQSISFTGAFYANWQWQYVSSPVISVSVQCPAGTTWNGSTCVAPPVSGSCAATHYNCSAGTLGATAEYPTQFQWWCNGSNGGSNVLCSEQKASGGASCSAVGTNSWGGNCSAQLNLPSVPSGTTVTNINSAPGYTGSVQWTCSNGAWLGPYNASCTPAGSPPPPPPPASPPPASPPPPPSCAGNQGASCSSSANFCGQTNTGTIQCSGACSASTPSNSLCPPPTVTISANPLRVLSGTTSTISWSSTYAQSCSESGPGLSAANLSGSSAVTIVSQSVFQISCSGPGGSSSAQATVNVVPRFNEF